MIIIEYILTLNTARNYVVQGTGRVDAGSSEHGRSHIKTDKLRHVNKLRAP